MVKKGQIIGYAGNSGDTRPSGKAGTHLHFELREGAQVFGGAGKWVDLSQANSVLSSGAVSDTGGSTAPGGSATDRAVEDFKVGMSDVTKMSSGMQGQANKGLGMLRGLYSGDTDQILDSMKGMAAGMGVSGDMWNYFTSNPASLTSTAPGSTAYTPPTGTTNNNVNIVVQVPDASAGEALKFSQLVKQYLDEDSLLSNTRSS
jgi:murein DD-endopeptidase MepM/ murein hydrolase activator NlpD